MDLLLLIDMSIKSIQDLQSLVDIMIAFGSIFCVAAGALFSWMFRWLASQQKQIADVSQREVRRAFDEFKAEQINLLRIAERDLAVLKTTTEHHTKMIDRLLSSD